MTGLANEGALLALESRIKKILPEQYQDCYEEVQPVSMGSAGLKYASDGKVAWDEIWGSFCDLAMAGGPPHRGTLLEPGQAAEIQAHSGRYGEVVDEICRGIFMVTGLAAGRASVPGWVRVQCASQTMAEWLVRAIVMENVSARCCCNAIELPAGPGYRMEKEIKNVITVIAKACHYWLDHMFPAQHREIGNLFLRMGAECALSQPAAMGYDFDADAHRALCATMGQEISEATGLRTVERGSPGWLGVECSTVQAAIWMMRAMVVSNVLARREGTALFIPVNPEGDPGGASAVAVLTRIHGFATARGVLERSEPPAAIGDEGQK